MGNERFTFLKYNVCDYLHVDGPLDAIMHFASPASPQDYLEFPIATLKVGALGTHKVLGLARAKGARFLLASTSEVYGDPLVNPQPEAYWGNVNPDQPAGRVRRGETIRRGHDHGLSPLSWPRYAGSCEFSIRLGPRMRANDGRVVSNFIVQALQGKPLSVFGEGQQTRSFCYVDDLVRGIVGLLMVDSDKTVEERTDKKFLYARAEDPTKSPVCMILSTLGILES